MKLTKPNIITMGNVTNEFTLPINGINKKQYFNFKPDVVFNYFAFVQQTHISNNNSDNTTVSNVVLNICNHDSQLISQMPVKNLSDFINFGGIVGYKFTDINYYNLYSKNDIDINNCYLTNTTLYTGTPENKFLRVDIMLFNISWQ
jgi:Tfp pilus assembly ATPase PilU